LKPANNIKIYSLNKSINQTLKYYLLVLNILCVTYFLNYMPDPQTGDMRHICLHVHDVSALSGISSL